MKRILVIIIVLALGLSVSAQQTCPDDNHPHAIDLGLPSGTKWACCNVGAAKPEKYGSYYAYGETGTKSSYDVDTYEWSNDWDFTEYSIYSNLGANFFTDEKVSFDTDDDAANANWHNEWRMPNIEEFDELIDHTTYKWVNNFNGTGVKGCLFTAPNGNCIFLPAAGWRKGASLNKAGTDGRYWSSSGSTNNQYIAWCLGFDSGSDDSYYDGIDRAIGQSIRAVWP